ncbi:MAG: type restriction enzyme subunit [Acidobacteriota bacterium]|jgi:type I restriction enzyme S subunit|nr:type restriction enzyme subunit [Acidobacteriota bacterium]
MKLNTIFEKFDQLADAPNAVAKMRELVLELAVLGKLVDQKPSEGDGHGLLVQIRKKNPPLDTESETVDSVTSLPSSWATAKLGEVAEIIRGVTFPGPAKSETRSGGDVACLRTASVQAEIDWDDLIFISPAHVSRSDQWVAPNDIMISMANSYALVGKVAIVRQVPQKATFGAFLAAIRPILIDPYFLLYVLRSPRMQAAFRASSSQTTNIANISLGRMRPLPFPLPPLAEQKRIVAKVDELMVLCERLEAQQQERETRHAALAHASLARFAEALTPVSLNFLFHKSYDIASADLRKSILNLAVRGKLVPQDPNDEPAEELLAEIEIERHRFAEAHKFRSPVAVPVDKSSVSFEIPPAWKWCRLSSMFNAVTDGDHLPPPKSDDGIAFLTIGNITTGKLNFEGSRFVTDSYYRALADFRRPMRGDILYTVVGATYGRPALVETDRPFCVQRHIAILKPSQRMEVGFLMAVLRSPLAYEQATASTTGTAQPTIPLGSLRNFLVPLPPLAEQRRIVIKVDQLMILVGQLEAYLAASRATGAKLLEALVAELTAGA